MKLRELMDQLLTLREEHGDNDVDVYCESHGQVLTIADVYQWRDDALVITVRDSGQ